MNHRKEQSGFEIKPTMEQKPFETPAVQNFFSEWCRINDSIEPSFVTRDEWESRGMKGISEKRADGKQTLYIPADLQLWEMIGVMEAVDHDTFAQRPEKKDIKKEEILRLGRMFEDAGIYIAQRLGSIEQGKTIAEALAEEFFDYGHALVSGKQPEQQQETDTDSLAAIPLPSQRLDEIDRWLAGDALYESRRARAEKAAGDDPQKIGMLLEEERKKTLSQFFRAADTAFRLRQKSKSGELSRNHASLQPWQSDTPVHSAFLRNVERGMIQEIETPKRELHNAIFRRGLEKLVSEMMPDRDWRERVNSLFEKLGMDLALEQRTLRESIDMEGLKRDLVHVRETGDISAIGRREKEIADVIQAAVSSFSYGKSAHNPSDMIANQYINCVGASILGGALFSEAGINYLVGDVPEHSVLFLVTSDGRVEWRDMLSNRFNEELTDGMIAGIGGDTPSLTIADIAAFSKHPNPEGLMFDVTSEKFQNKLSWVKEGERLYVTVFEPEHGQRIQLSNNTGNALWELGRDEEAIEAYQQSIILNPGYAYPYNGLGNALHNLGRNEEAVDAYRQSIRVNPTYTSPYNGLGNALIYLGQDEKAIEVFRQALALDHELANPYYGMGIAFTCLGNYEKAIESYRMFIQSADKKKAEVWIKRAEDEIADLELKRQP